MQTSGISDPTAREAIDNIMIMDAIRSGDLKSIIRDLDEEVMQLHETEVRTLRNMKEDLNQSTNAKNTSSSDFSKTMDSAAEMSTVRSREETLGLTISEAFRQLGVSVIIDMKDWLFYHNTAVLE